MANYSKIIEHYPEMADFPLNELIAFRGDILSYRGNLKRASFSTDAQGFRHSTLDGKTMSVVDCIRSDRYGIVLGASNIFGTGVAGNENTLPSLLADRFGFPFANAAMPGGNSRNLHTSLVGLLAGARQPPAVVILSNGGDLANFCEAGIVDPVFGSPNRMQMKRVETNSLNVDLEAQFERLLVFSALWASATATLCRMYKTPLVMAHLSSFFAKTEPTPVELDCKLGQPERPGQRIVLSRFAAFTPRFVAKRAEIAKNLNMPLAGAGLLDRLTFVDEFHLDRDGVRMLSQAVGDTIEPLVASRKPKAKKAKA
ncbi:MAG: hypothetical protein ABIS39_06070 [Sphingomicrobium sp.]